MNSDCPNKLRKLTGHKNYSTCEDCVKGQRIKFMAYNPKTGKPIRVRGHITEVFECVVYLKNVKYGRKWLKEETNYRPMAFTASGIRVFEPIKLCTEGQAKYQFLCQNEEEAVGGERRDRNHLSYRPKSVRELGKPCSSFWHKLYKTIRAWWYEIKLWWWSR
jgi:hypothetical protein